MSGPNTANFDCCYDMGSVPNLEEEFPFWAPSSSSSNDLSDSTGGSTEDISSRPWSVPSTDVSRPLVQLDDLDRIAEGSCQSSDGRRMHFFLASSATPESPIDGVRAPSDLAPLIPKPSSYKLNFRCGNYSSLGDSSHSTPTRLEELKNWLWLQQVVSSELDIGSCFHAKWLHRCFGPFRNFLRKASVRRWFIGSQGKRKQALTFQNTNMQAALSVASVAAAIAAVAAATAASTTNEAESKTGLAVASAATLVAAQCADVAKSMGADHNQVASAVTSAAKVQGATDILNLTVAAAMWHCKTSRQTHECSIFQDKNGDSSGAHRYSSMVRKKPVSR